MGSSFSSVTGFGMVPSIRSPCTSASMPAVSMMRSCTTLMIAIADSSPRAPNERIVSMPSFSGICRSQRIRSNDAPGFVTAARASRPSSASVTWTMPIRFRISRTQVRTCDWSSTTRMWRSELSAGIEHLPHLLTQRFRGERLLQQRDALLLQAVQDRHVARIAGGEEHLHVRPEDAYALHQRGPAHPARENDVRQEQFKRPASVPDHSQRLLAAARAQDVVSLRLEHAHGHATHGLV